MKKLVLTFILTGLLVLSGYIFVNKNKGNEQTYKGTFVYKGSVSHGYLY